MKTSLEALIKPVIAIAKSAATDILTIYNSSYDIEKKDDQTPLTTADIAAHKNIVEGLKALTPNIPILSEESSSIPFETRSSWNQYWLVDPLDGTREFIKRNGEFTVNIALIENNLPVLGVIYVPVTDVYYYACEGNNAFKCEKNGNPQEMHALKTANEKIIVAGSRSHRDTSLENFLQNIGEHELISMGSSLKSCLVAEGRVDIYPRLGPTSEWDTAAAQCIVEQAGGFLTTVDGEQLKYNTKDSLLNPHFLVFADEKIPWKTFL